MNVIRRLIMSTIVLLIVFGVAEALALAFSQLYPTQFRPSADAIRKAIDFDEYRRFLTRHYDAELGWRNPTSIVAHPTNCLGERNIYTFDDRGARWSGPRNPVDIIVVGDSYTRGAEADDDETYPFWLHSLTGLGVANYGVSDTCPLQATMQFEGVASRHPEVRIAILGIMYTNLLRFPTRLRFAISPTSWPFSFKPYSMCEWPSLWRVAIQTCRQPRRSMTWLS